MASNPSRFAKVAEAMRRVENKNRWYVIPHDDRWVVIRERAQRATRVFPNKTEAVELARSLATQANGEVVVSRRDGRMQTREVTRKEGGLETVYSYGEAE